MVSGGLNWLETQRKQCAGQGSFRIVVLGSAWVECYLQHLRDGRSSLIADFIISKVDACNGGVCLSEIERKNTVRGGANSTRNAWKMVCRCG